MLASLFFTIAFVDRKAMVIAHESSDSQESNISELATFGDITFFKASALWADAFYKSKCPSVCPSVCPSAGELFTNVKGLLYPFLQFN